MYRHHFSDENYFKKEKRQCLEPWILLIDLLKAFDCVPREMLWKILTTFDVPKKMISLLKMSYANFVVKFTVDDVTQTLDCIIYVK